MIGMGNIEKGFKGVGGKVFNKWVGGWDGCGWLKGWGLSGGGGI